MSKISMRECVAVLQLRPMTAAELLNELEVRDPDITRYEVGVMLKSLRLSPHVSILCDSDVYTLKSVSEEYLRKSDLRKARRKPCAPPQKRNRYRSPLNKDEAAFCFLHRLFDSCLRSVRGAL